MKRYLILLTAVILGVVLGTGLSRLNKSSDQIIFPEEIVNKYTITLAQTMLFADNKEEYLMAGFTSDTQSPDNPNSDKSFIGIYKKSRTGFSLVYKFSPLFPDDAAGLYMNFEDMWQTDKKSAIVTTWSQIGASYFGKYPIVIAYQNGSFTAVPFYGEDIAENPQLKDITWTTKDVIVKNYFDQANTVKTILTQGTSVEDNQIVLKFYGDNECRACEHKYIYLEFPVEI